MDKSDLVVVLGATATGKTALANHVAARIDGAIISADSRQVYRGMDIGTGKDLSEFVVDGQSIPYHLIDIVEAGSEYNVFQYQEDFLAAYQLVQAQKKMPILCGGTGMYIDAVVKGYRFLPIPEDTQLREALEKKPLDELVAELKSYKELHNTTDTVHKKRVIRAIEVARYQQEHQATIRDFPKINAVLFGIQFDRDVLKKRISQRLRLRLEEGMVDEVQRLLDSGVSADRLKFYGLEYKWITRFLLNEIDYPEMVDRLTIAIHQFSKRQATWFRKMEREGFVINWIDGNLSMDQKAAYVQQHLVR